MGSIAARILDYGRTADTHPSFLELIVPMYLVHAQVTGPGSTTTSAPISRARRGSRGPRRRRVRIGCARAC